VKRIQFEKSTRKGDLNVVNKGRGSMEDKSLSVRQRGKGRRREKTQQIRMERLSGQGLKKHGTIIEKKDIRMKF